MALAGVAAAGFFVPGVNKTFAGLFKTTSSEVVRYRVQPLKLPITVNERGNLKSGKNIDVMNFVEGTTTIIFIVPEGTKVNQGDKVCELDSATLRDNLINQRIQTKKAEADFLNAEKTRQVAEISVQEYMKGTYPLNKQTIEGQIKQADSELARAKDRLDWSKKMVLIQYVSESQKIGDELTFQKAEISKANAIKDMEVLEQYTYRKNVTELEAAVQKAKSDELAKQATLQLESDKEKKLEKQIENCILLAPNDGLVVYANDADKMRGNSQVLIEEGASVRERQKIFSLPDITNMQVDTKVHESMVDRVSKGLPARIKVESLPGVQLNGTVQTIQPLPDAGGWMSSDVKMYTTLVSVDGYNSGLRPGMSAQVEILVAQLDNVLAVPVQAVVQTQGKDYVFVMLPDGGYDQREVKVGVTNQRLVEIKEGLKAGEDVAMNWQVLMTEEKKNALLAPSKDSAKGKGEWSSAAADKAKAVPPKSPGDAPKGGDPAKGGASGKGTRKGGGGGGMGGMNPAIMEKMQNIPTEDRARMRDASPEERAAILKAAGFTDEEIQQMSQRRAGGGGGGRGPGGGGGGGGGGGFGGPGGGGPGQ